MQDNIRYMYSLEILIVARYSYRASTGSEGRVRVCHKPTVCHIGSLKYSHQPPEPDVFIELRTDKSLQYINICT